MRKNILFIVILLLSVQTIRAQWIATTKPTGFNLFDCSFLNKDTGYVCGYGNALFKTLNGGVNWVNLSFPGTAQDIRAVHFFDVNTGMVCSTNDTMYRTTNGGVNWYLKIPMGFQVSNFFFLNNNTGWATSTGKIAKTTNGGLNWTVNNSVTYGPLYFVNEQTGWITEYVSGGSNIYKSTNGGTNWTLQYSTNNFKILYSLYFVDQNTGWASGYRESIFKTTDGGTNWTEQNSTASGQGLYSVAFINSNTGWIGGDAKMYYTSNGGSNWSSIAGPGRVTRVQFVSPTTGWYVSSNGNVYRTLNTGGLTGVISSQGNYIPGKYNLNQNYPNPFNPTTTISFELPMSGLTELKIYDIQGREIAVLINEELNQGKYSITFDASKLSSGVYLYKINSRDFSQAKKMFLIK